MHYAKDVIGKAAAKLIIHIIHVGCTTLKTLRRCGLMPTKLS